MLNKAIRRSAWAVAMMIGLGVGASFVSAAEEKVDIGKVPPFIRHEIEDKTRGASNIQVIRITTEGRPESDYSVKYDEHGKEMLLRLGPTGEVLQQGESPTSKHKEEQARIAAAKSPAEKARIEDEAGAEREKQDRQRFSDFQAAAAQEATVHPENVQRSFTGLREMSEEYNSKDLRRIPGSELPPGVRKTFDMETLGTTNIDYYRYNVDGKLFYSAHYTTDDGQRVVCRVDQYGKLLGKNELRPIIKPSLDYKAVGGLLLNQLPPNIQATIQRDTAGDKDRAYYKITRDGKLFYTVHYTTPQNQRYDLWLDPQGDVVSRMLTALQPGDSNYKKYEWGE